MAWLYRARKQIACGVTVQATAIARIVRHEYTNGNGEKHPMSEQPMKVTISVGISRSAQGSYQPGESISYNQEFTINVTGFAQVAKILGDLDEAMNGIRNDDIYHRLNAVHSDCVKRYGADSLTAQILSQFVTD